MSTFSPGDSVTVTFDGLQHPGVVDKPVGHGFIRCKIHIDPLADYGSQTPRLGIESIVCVRESDVEHTSSAE